jgi:hypothetical protein
MFAIYRASADKLDAQFLEGLNTAFAHEEVEITVSEANDTAYRLRPPANRERLLRAVHHIETDRNVVVPDQQAFQ